MGVKCDYVPPDLKDFYIKIYPDYVPPGEIWYIPTGSEYCVKDSLTTEGKIVVGGKLIIET